MATAVALHAQAPGISTQPAAQGVAAGGAASFSVVATGAAPLSYQWYRNGAALAGQTAATIALTNVQAANAGNYSVTVTNAAGAVLSNVALLTLNAAPVFTGVVSSAGLIVQQGTNAVLTVAATGNPAPTYQWFKNGAALSGQTAATLTLSSVQPAGAGVYTVTATNSFGSVTSGSIELTVQQIGTGSGPLAITTSLGTQVNGNVDGATGELTGGATSGGPSAVVAPRVGGITAKSGLILDLGSSATLTAAATGSPAPTYQWLRDGTALPGQTGASLTLTNVQPTDAATYSVRATNSAGTATSDGVKVTIIALGANGSLTITGGDGTQIAGSYDTTSGVLTGSVTAGGAGTLVAPKIADIVNRSDLLLELGKPATLSVIASGSPAPAFQWFRNGTAISGATLSSYTIGRVATTDAGIYTVKVTNASGSVTSNPINVSATSLTSGSGPLIIATSGGTQIDGTVDANGGLTGGVTTSVSSGTTAAPAIAGLNSRGGAFVNQGSTLALAATVTGNPAPAFQWFRDGTALAGQTNAFLSIANAQPGDAGNYTVRATNSAGSATSDAVVVTVASIGASGQLRIAGGDGTQINGSYDTVSGALTGGVITGGATASAPRLGDVTSKSDLLLEIGKSATLSVSAAGSPAPSYQWFKDGVAISGATNFNYLIASVAVSDAGSYTVRATNSAGSATSAATNVSVTSLTGGSGPLVIATAGGTQVNGTVDATTGALTGGVTTNAPAGTTVAPQIASLGSQGGLFLNQGSTAALTATATGLPIPAFQWFRNSVALAGQTGSSLTFNNAQASDAGSYTVRATNSAGSATSDAIAVTVASISDSGQISIAGGNGTQITANYNATTGGLTGTSVSTGSLGSVAAKITALTSNPATLLVDRGAPATLVVTGTGNPVPTYQWFKAGTALAGQTNPTLAFASVQDADAGDYTVRLTNSAGAVTSAAFSLSVVALGSDGSVAVSTSTGTQVSAEVDPDTGALLGTVATGSSVVAPKIAAIDTAPSALLLNAGSSATLSVLANASPLPTYQWFKDGLTLAGRTGADLPITNVQASDAGTYLVRVTNSAGSVLSGPIIVSVVRIGSDGSVSLATGGGTQLGGSVNPTAGTASGSGSITPSVPTLPTEPFAKLTNFSSRGTAGAGDNAVVTGFVVGGTGTRQLLVRAIGPGLGAFGVTGTLPTPVLTLNQGARLLATNTSWTAAPNAVDIAQAAVRVGAFALNPDGRDAALLATVDPGAYTANLSGSGTATGQGLIELYDASAAQAGGSRVVNFSTRQKLGADAALTAGFYVAGNTSKRVLVRAVGPTLQQSFGLTGVLPAPVLRVLSGGTLLASNRDYRTSPDSAAIVSGGASVGAFAFAAGAADSAVILILAPGSYNVQITDATGATGTAMVEIYELP